MNSIYQSLAELEKDHGSAVLCTVVKSEGSTPRHVGSKMLVYPDGHFIGTVGGGDLEHRVIDEAWMALSDGEPRFLHYNMVDPSRGDVGVCGGQVEVFVEPILADPMIVLIGAGHVGKATAHLAKWLGFRVVVMDDRVEFVTPEWIPNADEYLPGAVLDQLSNAHLNAQSYIVAVTRGYNIDVGILPTLLDYDVPYIGVIGSKRRWTQALKELRDKGVAEEKLARVHAPIGLELNAETPEEIAVSIMAEIVMLRNNGTGQSMKMNND